MLHITHVHMIKTYIINILQIFMVMITIYIVIIFSHLIKGKYTICSNKLKKKLLTKLIIINFINRNGILL